MRFLEKLEAGQTVVGPFSKTSDPSMIEAMGYAGFDFIIIDLEHGPYSILNAQNLVTAAQIAGTFPIIRVPENSASAIGKALDIGALGVQVPQISNVEQAKLAVEYAKFGPIGMRGVCRFVRAAEFSNKDRFEYFAGANQNYLILQLEGEEAINNIEAIIAVAHVNIIFLGPYDLSQALGVPGQINHPTVIEKIEYIVNLCKANSKKTGIFTDNLSDARRWRELGLDYISYSVDVGIIQEASKTIISEILR